MTKSPGTKTSFHANDHRVHGGHVDPNQLGLARPMALQSAIAPTSDGEYHEQKIPKISLSCASSSADLPECIELATKSPITAAANRCCSALSAITGNCLPRMKIPLPNLITTACSLTQ